MRNYFGIHEKVNCGSCNGLNDISLIECSYCGVNFHATSSGNILTIREKYDTLLTQGELQAANELITRHADISYPILMFRFIISEFNGILLNDTNIIAPKYHKHLDLLGELMDISQDYFKAYVQYVSNILPYPNNTLSADDYRSIIGHWVIVNYDTEEKLTQALKLQYANSTLSTEMMKEIKFYLNPANQINVESFAKKKKYLSDIFQQVTGSL